MQGNMFTGPGDLWEALIESPHLVLQQARQGQTFGTVSYSQAPVVPRARWLCSPMLMGDGLSFSTGETGFWVTGDSPAYELSPIFQSSAEQLSGPGLALGPTLPTGHSCPTPSWAFCCSSSLTFTFSAVFACVVVFAC